MKVITFACVAAANAQTCAELGCNAPYVADRSCQCNSKCTAFGNCCGDYTSKCGASPTPSPMPGPAPSCGGDPPPKPAGARDLNGVAWPKMCVDKTEGHFFGIGDWGGDTANGHTWENPGKANQRGGKVDGPDDWGQQYVARQMRAKAANVDPDFVLNAGDNFYPGGIDKPCMQSSNLHDPTGQFHNCFHTLYNGALSGKPWFSVLGNHDYGGRSFGMGWDYQIMHTWHTDSWRMPGQYWSQTVEYNGFSVDIFMLDSNFMDALPVGADPNHNICQVRDSSAAYCWDITLDSCPSDLNKVWRESLDMLESGLAKSTATWKIIVTHFPGPAIASQSKIKELNSKYGIDLLFTGHTHYQYASGTDKDIPYIISGGGGGVTSDSKPSTSGRDGAYGFVDFTITKDTLKYDMHSWGGFDGQEIVMSSRTIQKAFGNVTKGNAIFV